MEATIRALPIGQAATEGQITVKRKDRNTYVLSLATDRYRKRWGTLAEILEDYALTAASGHLPQPVGPSWF